MVDEEALKHALVRFRGFRSHVSGSITETDPNPPDEGAWAQEFLGDAMVVNGKVRPYHEVEPRKYRLRIANTANSRFFSPSLSNGQSVHVIGSDQGLLAAPVEMYRIVLAPAERTDLVVDFGLSRAQNIVLQSDGLDLMQFDGAMEWPW
jgi:spore coat protein A